MRWKYVNENNDQYRCFGCCHVRTGTIFLGLLSLFMDIVFISCLVVTFLHPELVEQQQQQQSIDSVGDVALDQNQVQIEGTGPNSNYSVLSVYWAKVGNYTNEDKFIGFLYRTGSLFLTVLLIYGAVRGIPGYLMPYFCLQVFDFCFTCLTIIGYFSYMPNIKKWIESQDHMPGKENLLAMDNDWLMLMVIMVFVLIMTVEAYLLGIVWSCYKYLVTSQQGGGTAIIRTYPTSEGEDGEMLLPPKYEDVILMSANEPPPPAYSN